MQVTLGSLRSVGSQKGIVAIVLRSNIELELALDDGLILPCLKDLCVNCIALLAIANSPMSIRTCGDITATGQGRSMVTENQDLLFKLRKGRKLATLTRRYRLDSSALKIGEA